MDERVSLSTINESAEESLGGSNVHLNFVPESGRPSHEPLAGMNGTLASHP